ncbi:hypothetical protein ABTX85_27280 [Streptomyces sp. NPDC096097]|uniref:hypothetical protein n=1 Tax=Streptomyces sp. NPDC096097 TaxID=3155546 RepID=UPI00332F962E
MLRRYGATHSACRPDPTGHDGASWSGHYLDNLEWQINKPVALAVFDGWLWRAARGIGDHTLYTAHHNGDHGWANRDLNVNWGITHGPAMAAHDNKLWILFRKADGKLYSAMCPRNADGPWGWSPAQPVGAPHAELVDEAAATVHNGKLYVMYRRP